MFFSLFCLGEICRFLRIVMLLFKIRGVFLCVIRCFLAQLVESVVFGVFGLLHFVIFERVLTYLDVFWVVSSVS